MPPQDRRRTSGGDRTIEGGPDGRALDGPGHDRRRARHSHYEGNGDRERGAGDVLEAGEAAVVDLLAPAGLVELHDPDVELFREVADRGVDEGQVAVLAHAQDRQPRALALEQGGVARALAGLVGRVAVDPVEGPRAHVIEQPLAQEAPEGRRMARAHADVLVEMEGGDL